MGVLWSALELGNLIAARCNLNRFRFGAQQMCRVMMMIT